MLNLEPLISRLVDDVLLALRGASLDELRALIGEPAASAPLRAVATLSAAAQPAPPPSPSPSPSPRIRAPRAKARRAPAVRPLAAEERQDPPEAQVSSEITDPEWLLAATSRPVAEPKVVKMPSLLEPVASVDDGPAQADDEDEGPPSAVRTATPMLREGESLARVSGGGLVIRRTKRV